MLKLTECNYLGRLLKFFLKNYSMENIKEQNLYICMQINKVCQLILSILVKLFRVKTLSKH